MKRFAWNELRFFNYHSEYRPAEESAILLFKSNLNERRFSIIKNKQTVDAAVY